MENRETQELTVQIDERENYGRLISYDKDVKLSCYSKRQIKSIYPKGNYKLKGECTGNKNNRSDEKGTLVYRNMEFPFYKMNTHSRLIYEARGYAACKGQPNHFIVLLKNVLLVRLLALLICAGIISGGYILYKGNSVKPVSMQGLDSNAVDWNGNLPEPNNGGVTEGIRIPGYKSITIAANTRDVKVNFVNPEQNKCYFVISLILSDTNEVLFKSKLVPPGKGFYNISLARALKPGTYSAKVNYDTFSMDASQTPLNGAVVNIDLIAQ